jgi:exodeoxyribonuclease V alpha subunit
MLRAVRGLPFSRFGQRVIRASLCQDLPASGSVDPLQQSKWQRIRRKEGIERQEFDLSSMRAVINKIIYHNEANGYSVMAISPKEALSQEVTVIGTFIGPSEGEHIEIQGGSWKSRGEESQILADRILPVNPTTVVETELYLSKFFKGIGRKRAKAIVDMFGVKVFDVIENNPSALLKVSGLGAKKLESVIQPYLERVSARELVDFLVKYGTLEEG